jgi:hypothetical protein
VDSPQIAPTNRKALSTPKSVQSRHTKNRSQLSTCPNSVPILPRLVNTSRLESDPCRSLISEYEDSVEKLSLDMHIGKETQMKSRPRSLDANSRHKTRREAARAARMGELNAASEHTPAMDPDVIQHPLFAYPMSGK